MEVVKMLLFSPSSKWQRLLLDDERCRMIACCYNVSGSERLFLVFPNLTAESLIDLLSIYFYAINRTNCSCCSSICCYLSYIYVISVAHLTVFLSREWKWGQLFNAICLLVVFVTLVCSNKPWYDVRRSQHWWATIRLHYLSLDGIISE